MLSLVDLVTGSAGTRTVDEDGNEDVLRLMPPVTAEELQALEAALPCPIPEPIRELLTVTRGFENGPLESMDFGGLPGGFGMEELFPFALPLAHDGFGNYWIVDLHADSRDWAPIWFVCHDPPVVAFQSGTLERFVHEMLRLANSPYDSELDTVHEQITLDIWRRNPGVVSVPDARSSGDPVVREFAESLDEHWAVVDLRNAAIGDGFSWGRYGPRTRVRRYGTEPVFAYEPKTRLQRLLGR